MIEIKDKKKCSGCYACVNICPKKCIEMNADEEGFWYPEVDKEKCIKCELCEKICPILNDMSIENRPVAYACYNKNEEIRKESSSGGIFTLLASHIIDKGGIVYGAAFNQNFEVEHIEVTSKQELSKLRGSKYVQSKLGNTYSKIKEHLKKNRLVYFSGTPCQIDGLLCFLNKKYDNLICQDIVCHGVPSPKVWKYYLEKMCNYENDNIKNISFRNKDNGWENFCFKIQYENYTYIEEHSKNVYMRSFLSNMCLRPSCYNCSSKSLHRSSDITLADFWGIKEVSPDFYDGQGTSLVIVNSENGKKLFEKILPDVNYTKVNLNKAIEYNSAAIKSVNIPKKRKKFMNKIFKSRFDRILNKCLQPSITFRVKGLLTKILKKKLSL